MPTEHDVRAMLLDLPEAGEVVVENWGDQPTYRVRKKMFALLGYGADTVCLKATRETQAALVEEEPDVFLLPPFFARHGWIDVVYAKVTAEELGELIEDAWRLTAPKRVVKAYDAEREAAEDA